MNPHGRPPTHGQTDSRTYRSWQSMRRRGLPVDPEWETFAGFVVFMGQRPPGRRLARIDRSKGFGPGNCWWATSSEITAATSELKLDPSSLAERARVVGLHPETLRSRLRAGWTWERAVSHPIRARMSRTRLEALGDAAKAARLAPVQPFTPSTCPSR